MQDLYIADYTAIYQRQHELVHTDDTDDTDHTDHTDQEYIYLPCLADVDHELYWESIICPICEYIFFGGRGVLLCPEI